MRSLDILDQLITDNPESEDILRKAFQAGTNIGPLYLFLSPNIIREEADSSDLLNDENYQNIISLDDDIISSAILRSDLNINYDDEQLCESISGEVSRAADRVLRLLVHENCH